MTVSWSARTSKALALTGVALSLGVLAAGPASARSVAPWYAGDFNAAHSRANTAESTLTPATVGNVVHKRTIAAAARGAECANTSRGRPIQSTLEVGGYTYAVANNVLTKANTSTGAVAWRKSLDRPWNDNYFQHGEIAYSSGYVFVGGDECGSASDPGGSLLALKASTGAVAWQKGFLGGLSDLVVSSGTVITIGTTDGSGGVLSAWRVSDGASLWQDFRGAYGNRVAVVGGVVISTLFDSTTGAERMQGVSLSTGAVRWTVNGHWGLQAGDLSGTSGHSLFVTTSLGRLNEFNPVTGAFVGAYPTTARNVLAVDGSRVYATCATSTVSAGVCAYSRSTRTQAWIRSNPSTLAGVGGAVLYLADGTALNSATGATIKDLWTGTATQLVEADSFVLASLTGTNTQVQVFGL